MSSSDAIVTKVREMIAKALDKELSEVTEDKALDTDLGADSIDLMELLMEAEETFDIKIPDEDREKLRTVGDVVSYIRLHIEE